MLLNFFQVRSIFVAHKVDVPAVKPYLFIILSDHPVAKNIRAIRYDIWSNRQAEISNPEFKKNKGKAGKMKERMKKQSKPLKALQFYYSKCSL